MSTNKCPVCVENVVNESKEASEVREKGILGLIKASKERKDEKHRSFRGSTSLLIHTSCCKNYTRTDTIKKDVREASTSKGETGPSQLPNSTSRTIVYYVHIVQRKKPKFVWAKGELYIQWRL